MSSEKLCSFCKVGNLETILGFAPLKYRGIIDIFPIITLFCDCCNNENFLYSVSKANENVQLEIKQEIDNMLDNFNEIIISERNYE